MRPQRPESADFPSLPRAVAGVGARSELICFDVFDTLVRRRVEPETTKDIVARRFAAELARRGTDADWTLLRHKRAQLETELGRRAESRGDDHEFRLDELIPLWVRSIRSTDTEWSANTNGSLAYRRADESLVSLLHDHEIAVEQAAAMPTPGIERSLTAAKDTGAKLVFVSDTYLDHDTVLELLRGTGLHGWFDGGYCSSTFMRTKRSGRLLKLVLEREGIEPSRSLLIGDNPYSDIEPALRLGMRTIHIRDKREGKRRARLRFLDRLSRTNPYWTGVLCQEIVESGSGLRPDSSPHYRLGLTLAPAFIAFARYILDFSLQHQPGRVFFLSREGLTFMRMYRALVRRLGLADRAPPAAYLAVSRAATFLASIDRLDLAQLDRMWFQYPHQSLSRLLRNLSLPIDEFAEIARRCGFEDFDQPIEDPAGHRPLRRFLANGSVRTAFLRHRDAARSLLRDYLAHRGFFDHSLVGMVDIGWKGSIQNNIYRAVRGLRDCPAIEGIYFGFTHVPGDDFPDSRKHGYIADTRRGNWVEEPIFKNGPVFEMFTTAPHGGVIGYRRLANGFVKPNIRIEDAERANFASHFAEVFRGVDDYFRQYLRCAPLLDASADDLRHHVLDRLRRYILYPTREEARQFLEYSHVENFGVYKVATYEFQGSLRRILFGGSPHLIPARLMEEMRTQFWPEAVLKRSRIPLANFLYDVTETSRAAGKG